jgi:hypothetical protein
MHNTGKDTDMRNAAAALTATPEQRELLRLALADAMPGSPGALLHRGPLRTGHARSRAHGPSKP